MEKPEALFLICLRFFHMSDANIHIALFSHILLSFTPLLQIQFLQTFQSGLIF